MCKRHPGGEQWNCARSKKAYSYIHILKLSLKISQQIIIERKVQFREISGIINRIHNFLNYFTIIHPWVFIIKLENHRWEVIHPSYFVHPSYFIHPSNFSRLENYFIHLLTSLRSTNLRSLKRIILTTHKQLVIRYFGVYAARTRIHWTNPRQS